MDNSFEICIFIFIFVFISTQYFLQLGRTKLLVFVFFWKSTLLLCIIDIWEFKIL